MGGLVAVHHAAIDGLMDWDERAECLQALS